MDQYLKLIRQAKLLANRMERISADSIWARRASGLRGEILRLLDEYETESYVHQGQLNKNADDIVRLRLLMESGYALLKSAAKELIR